MDGRIIQFQLNKETLKGLIEKKNVTYNISESIETILQDKLFYENIGIKYGIIYNFDSVKFGKIDDLKIDLDNIIEARLFSEDMEIDIRINENKIEGSIFIDNEDNKYVINQNLKIRDSEHKNIEYKTLKIKKYVRFDDDNQGYIFYVKPCELSKED